jgi:hypothetical protein
MHRKLQDVESDSAAAATVTVSVDYAGAREIVYSAVRRASCFMGLALNAARDPEFKDFSLSREIEVSFMPDALSDSALSQMKSEFELWTVTNGIRELIEAFSVFLDRLVEYSLLAQHNGKQVKPETLRRKIAQVKNKGLPGKQLMLRKEFGITSDLAADIKTIYETRNCLSHERGIVTPEFYNAKGALETRWRVIDLFLKRKSGEEIKIEFRKQSRGIAGPGDIVKRTAFRVRSFPLGTIVRLTAKDVAEICIFLYLAADSFLFPAIEYAKKHGLT